MKKRLITGILYIGVIVGFFFLRNIHPWFFGILVYAFSLIGTYEMVHAFSYRKVKEDGTEEPPAFEMALSQKIAVFAFAALFTPVYYLVEWLAGEGVGYRGMLILAFVFALALLCLLVFDHKRCSLQGAGGAHGAALRGIQYQYRWIGRVRRSCGTASDAIFANSGPSGPGEHADRHSDFARRKRRTDCQEGVPRNGGPGGGRIWARSAHLSPPPGASLASFWASREKLAARKAAKSLCENL